MSHAASASTASLLHSCEVADDEDGFFVPGKACFSVKYGLTRKTAAAYWVISSKPIARQADQACGRPD
jgi:hypothetical protein